MKILHVVNISFVLPYYIGSQFDYFNEKNVEFFVACAPSAHLVHYAEKKHFKYYTLKILRAVNPFQDLIAIAKLFKLIKKEKFELVIGHTPKAAMVAMVAAYLAGVKKRVYFRHGLMYETSTGLKRLLLKNVEKLTGRLATKVVCVSSSVRRKSESEHLNSAEKNLILNRGTCNGVDVKIFSRNKLAETQQEALSSEHQIKSEDRVVGYVGRLVNDKGINELVLAWKLLLKHNSNIKLLLVGPFEERDAIDLDTRLMIENDPSIISTGLTSNVLPYYGLMDIFILPSYREGFPTVVLEASSMEIPIITTYSTGCIDAIVENETGIFCDINAESIAQKITFYLENSVTAKLHGEQGRKFVLGNFQQERIWEEIADKVLELKK